MNETKNSESESHESHSEFEPRKTRRKFKLKEPVNKSPDPGEPREFSEIFRMDPKDRLGKAKSGKFNPLKGTQMKETWADSPLAAWGFRIIGVLVLAGFAFASYLMMRWLWPFGGLMIVFGFITVIAFWLFVSLQLRRAGGDGSGASPVWLSRWMAHFH